LPFWHVEGAVQVTPHTPQSTLLVIVSTQEPAQLVNGAAQVH
jgi:hypothetical protein